MDSTAGSSAGDGRRGLRLAAAGGSSAPGSHALTDRLVHHFIRLGAAPDGAERLVESSEAVLNTLRLALEHGRFRPALDLVRVVEPAFLLAGRWGAWASSLEIGLVAARRLGDARAEGWVLHEQGVRAMAVGSFTEAGDLLSRALAIRVADGEPAEAEMTRSQLDRLRALGGAAG